MDNTLTRKDEIIFSTNKVEEMLNMYLATPLKRFWDEDFVDEDTGQVVNIERSEMIAQQGQLIDQKLLTEISFLLQTGDIKEVKVSNLQRLAVFSTSEYKKIYSITSCINNKKKKFLLYATNIAIAIEIAKDFIELNYEGIFFFTSIKEIDSCIIIDRKLSSADNTKSLEKEKNYYKIIVSVLREEDNYEQESTFITYAQDVDSCMIIINDYIKNKIREENTEITFETKIKSGVIIPCDRIIDIEFSLAYDINSNK